MKRLALLLFLGALASAGFVRLQPAGDAVSPVYVDNELQHVLVPPTDSTSPAGDNGGVVGVPSGGLNLADVLTVERRASLWWDYARDVASVVSSGSGGSGRRGRVKERRGRGRGREAAGIGRS
jgi:hypothetical protein